MTWLLVGVIISLLVVIGFLIKALQVQLAKHRVYEQWIFDTQELVDKTFRTMQDLDERQMFSKDDEVGSVFQQLVDVVDYLNKVTSGK
jgi:hypothetical protein